MKISDFPKKRASSSELALAFEGFVRFIAHKPETEKKALGAIFKVLLQHIRFQESEIERISQSRFSVVENNEPAPLPTLAPSNPSLGRVTNPIVMQSKEYAERGERLWTLVSAGGIEKYMRWLNHEKRTREEVLYEANTWARANGRETL